MGDLVIFDFVATLFRWGAPLIGAVIMFLAWRRFAVAGSGQAMAGFVLMLAAPVAAWVFQIWWTNVWRPGQISPNDIGMISFGSTALSMIGLVIVVLAMRRMIARAGGRLDTVQSGQ